MNRDDLRQKVRGPSAARALDGKAQCAGNRCLIKTEPAARPRWGGIFPELSFGRVIGRMLRLREKSHSRIASGRHGTASQVLSHRRAKHQLQTPEKFQISSPKPQKQMPGQTARRSVFELGDWWFLRIFHERNHKRVANYATVWNVSIEPGKWLWPRGSRACLRITRGVHGKRFA